VIRPGNWIAWRKRSELLKRGLLVLALLIQGYVGAAHFHNLAASNAGPAFAVTLDGSNGLSGGADLPANLPDGHNADCAVCHLTGLATASLVPASMMALPVLAASLLNLPDYTAPRPAAAESHSPRGPPPSFVHS
jgi:hypothetical protein